MKHAAESGQRYREIAGYYFKDYRICSVPVKGKSPLVKWRQYRDKELTGEEIQQFNWSSATGLGALTGHNDVRIIDIDKVEDEQLARMLMKFLGLPDDYEWLIKSGSGKGYHLYFRTKEDEQFKDTFQGDKTVYILKPIDESGCKQLELRWKGCMVVMPPSEHDSGQTYDFVLPHQGAMPIKNMTYIDTQKLTEGLKELFHLPEKRKEKEEKKEFKEGVPVRFDEHTRSEVAKAVECMAGKIEDYETWNKVAFACASLGEQGREYFLQISTGNPKYTDSLDYINTYFDEHLSSYNGKITLGTLFEIAKRYGYRRTVQPFWGSVRNTKKIYRERLNSLLTREGYAKVKQGASCLYIHRKGMIMRQIEIPDLKDFLTEFVDEHFGEAERTDAREAMMNNAAGVFTTQQLDFLPSVDEDVMRDTAEAAYFYFKNGCVKVTRENMELIPYDELEKFVWDTWIIDREISFVRQQSDFEEFIRNIARGDEKRYAALTSAIGYLLHTYKDPQVSKAVIFMDERLSDDAFGRSGKGIVANGIGKLRRMVTMDMKSSKLDSGFLFSGVNQDTQVVFMDEAGKKFPIERMFSLLAEGIRIEKKHKDEFYIPYNRSPKFVISTNYTVSGRDDSSLDRQFVVEFSDYYTKDYRPFDEFGKRFFDDWDEEEWNNFYLFEMQCCQFFLKNGLVAYEHANLNQKKLIDEAGEELADFLLEIPLNTEFLTKEMYNKFLSENEDLKQNRKFTLNLFTRRLNIYANIYGYTPVKRKSDSNYYMTLKTKSERRTESGGKAGVRQDGLPF